MDVVLLIGRIVFGFLFVGGGINHLTKADMMAGYADSRGVPMAKPATMVSGVVILVAGLMVILGVWGDLGALLIVLFLVPTALLMHGFWKDDGEEAQMEQVHFMKDLALAGAALAFIWVFSSDPGITLTDGLF